MESLPYDVKGEILRYINIQDEQIKLNKEFEKLKRLKSNSYDDLRHSVFNRKNHEGVKVPYIIIHALDFIHKYQHNNMRVNLSQNVCLDCLICDDGIIYNYDGQRYVYKQRYYKYSDNGRRHFKECLIGDVTCSFCCKNKSFNVHFLKYDEMYRKYLDIVNKYIM